jgi:hypothetical protein
MRAGCSTRLMYDAAPANSPAQSVARMPKLMWRASAPAGSAAAAPSSSPAPGPRRRDAGFARRDRPCQARRARASLADRPLQEGSAVCSRVSVRRRSGVRATSSSARPPGCSSHAVGGLCGDAHRPVDGSSAAIIGPLRAAEDGRTAAPRAPRAQRGRLDRPQAARTIPPRSEAEIIDDGRAAQTPCARDMITVPRGRR